MKHLRSQIAFAAIALAAALASGTVPLANSAGAIAADDAFQAESVGFSPRLQKR